MVPHSEAIFANCKTSLPVKGTKEAPLLNIWSGTKIPALITASIVELEETFPVYIACFELDLRWASRLSLDLEIANAGGPRWPQRTQGDAMVQEGEGAYSPDGDFQSLTTWACLTFHPPLPLVRYLLTVVHTRAVSCNLETTSSTPFTAGLSPHG